MKWLTIGKWSLNVLLLIAGVGCLGLAIFGHDQAAMNADGTAVTNRVGTFLTGFAFLGIGSYMTWYTWKQSQPVPAPVPTPIVTPPPAPTQEEQPPEQKS